MSDEIPLGKYRHYKGDEYELIAVALHTETHEKMVVYRALYSPEDLIEEYGEYPIFVRPYAMFTESVLLEGVSVPRFEFQG